MGCMSHELNTILKRCIDQKHEQRRLISLDLNSGKVIVRIFKQGGWNNDVPNGFALFQEVETRFGTKLDVVVRFIKSQNHAGEILEVKDHKDAMDAFQSIIKKSQQSSQEVKYTF